MSEKRRALVSLILVVAVFGIVACAKLPQAEIDQAEVALAGAGDAEAAVYAQTEWEGAQQAMNAAKAEVERQNAKFVLVRSYKKAEALLADAKTSAEKPSRRRSTARKRCAFVSKVRSRPSKPV